MPICTHLKLHDTKGKSYKQKRQNSAPQKNCVYFLVLDNKRMESPLQQKIANCKRSEI